MCASVATINITMTHRDPTSINSAILRTFAAALITLLAACATNPIPGSQFPHDASHAVPPHDSALTRTLNRKDAKSDQSAFKMLSVGLDGLAARLEVIDRAEQALDLQYYIFRADESGMLVARALLRAADRGVRIRILVDDGESVAGDERLFALAAHPQIQIRVFNPFRYRGHFVLLRATEFLLHKSRLDHRMHNKVLVADGALAMIGGRNIGDQYFQIDPESQFGDDDVITVGPIVPQLSRVFDLFWNSPQTISITALDPRHSSAEALEDFRRTHLTAPKLGLFPEELQKRLTAGTPLADFLSQRNPPAWATAELIYDSPDKASPGHDGEARTEIYPDIALRVAKTTRDLSMITPYFVPSDAEMTLLQQARRRNVRVSVLTNSLEAAPDVVAHAGYTKYRKTLIAQGVDIHEIRAAPEGARGTGQKRRISDHGNYGLHAKLYIFDRQSLFVGSMNFDQRSKHLNTEIGLLIDSAALAQAASERFAALVSLGNSYAVSADAHNKGRLLWTTERDGHVVDTSREPARNAWQRLAAKALVVLPLDHEL